MGKKAKGPAATPFSPKRLAHTDKKVRDRSIKVLSKWLSTRDTFEEVEMMKVWKGLFYCFWHSDKPLVQLELANRLSSLLFVFKSSFSLSLLYGKSFFITLFREWHGIDRLRLDKFMLFVRIFVHHLLLFLSTRGWQEEEVQSVMSLISETGLSQKVQRNAPGIVYHLADVYIPELSSVLRKEKTASPSEREQKIEDSEDSFEEIDSASSVMKEVEEGRGEDGEEEEENQKEEKEEEDGTYVEDAVEELGNDSTDLVVPESPLLSLSPSLLCSLISPFTSLITSSDDSTTVKRVRKSVFDPLCRELQEADAIGDDRAKALLNEISNEMFLKASSHDTHNKNRRLLYNLRNSFQVSTEYSQKSIESSESSSSSSVFVVQKSTRKRKRDGEESKAEVTDTPSLHEPSSLSDATESPFFHSPTPSSPPLTAPSPPSVSSLRSPKRKKESSTPASTPNDQSKKVKFALHQNKVQEPEEAKANHPPLPHPTLQPVSPALRRTPKVYPPPPQSPGLKKKKLRKFQY